MVSALIDSYRQQIERRAPEQFLTVHIPDSAALARIEIDWIIFLL